MGRSVIQKIPHIIKTRWQRFAYNFTNKNNLDWFDRVRYKQLIGHRLNLKNPQNINEKLLWLNRYWQHPLKAECADKLQIHDYLKIQGLECLSVPLLGVWNTPDEIDFDKLPNQFVLKCNHGCGCNIICQDKSVLDICEVKKKLSHWLIIDFGKIYNEKHYSKIKKRIICEVYLPALNGVSLIDYKLHCINGEPQFFLLCTDRNIEKHQVTLSSYSLEWNRLDYLIDEGIEALSKPKNLDKMIENAKVLSKPFPYVRVDFYEIEDQLMLGELTFTPYGNIMIYYKTEILYEMGQKLILPNKYIQEE